TGLAGALGTATRLGGSVGADLANAAKAAFVHGVAGAAVVGAGVLLVTAAAAYFLIPDDRTTTSMSPAPSGRRGRSEGDQRSEPLGWAVAAGSREGERVAASAELDARPGQRKSAFSEVELGYLTGERRLGRLATVGRDGLPHIAPVGWSYRPDEDAIEVGGRNVDRTEKYRDVGHSGRAAIVIDEMLPPWRQRGLEVRGRAEAVPGPVPVIRIHPDHVESWGLNRADGAPAEGAGR
ncbi:MAG TPA: PPOX class F420-dependent oxidoreductase, partial [Acidimicrobiales bacterium]|nr:PPOX class F420-dependent oxidoreductase [Acidimicrobiales bacterium]